MFAVLPGGPRMSYFTTFGLNCTILIPAPELALRSCEANTLCRRVTTRVDTDRTTTSSSGIQARLSRPLIDIALTRSPPAARPQCCPRTRQATDTLRSRERTRPGQLRRKSWLLSVIVADAA